MALSVGQYCSCVTIKAIEAFNFWKLEYLSDASQRPPKLSFENRKLLDEERFFKSLAALTCLRSNVQKVAFAWEGKQFYRIIVEISF